jgi:hypothetical protein
MFDEELFISFLVKMEFLRVSHTDQIDLELSIFLLKPTWCWDYRCEMPCLASIGLFFKKRFNIMT